MNIDNKQITVSHGETAYIGITLTQDGAPYELKDGDKIIVTIDGIGAQELEADCVWHMPTNMRPGVYWYDVRLMCADGDVIYLSAPTVYNVTEVARDGM
ncbi:MAG: hypothetical protein MJZ55_00150 [Paludibacteraceae bacterium]|nr:hypothetical protein [Paludibacteraceae bacterium]